ncbi:MAG TPA: hypothetical protein VLY03_01425 [Bacteroidota bacterium]|nr:hypothetical protein [Bacteroidota bacterium]
MRKLLLAMLFLTGTAYSQESPHGPITIACEACHSTDSWLMRPDATFDHTSTGFPLDGQHRTVQCRSCHENLHFTAQSPDCASCHTDVHRQELGSNCLQCHTTASWKIADMRQKHQSTRFPLIGRHTIVDCEACHQQASSYRYAGTPIECISCHKADFEGATSPNHVASGFPVDCKQCHKVEAMNWGGSFDHNLTGFPLTGAHRTIICSDCHHNNVFTHMPTDCYSCHAATFASAVNPNHVSGGFSHDCQTCHTTIAWQPATFNHSATAFPLTGAHVSLACQECHVNGNYQLHYTGCYQCHSSNFQSATSPDHVGGAFSHDCTTCHSTNVWQPSTFSHSSTAFPLTGAHTSVTCQSCHVSGNYALHYTDCYQCHQADFTQTNNPSHVSGNFSHTCTTCHTTTAWQPASFDHSTTAFPLTGAHISVACINCHTNNNFQLVYTDCYQCHQSEYQAQTNPNHATNNFSHNCLTCHTTTAWTPSTFDHSTTAFPLTGAHVSQACIACHVGGNYQLVYSGCYTCHASDYNGTSNPNHTAAGIPKTCETCHTTTDWSGATFTHTWFPMTHGNANSNCSTCHTNSSDYSVFQCTVCHTQSQTNSDHNGVSGYVWNSINCYQCHPTGRGG